VTIDSRWADTDPADVSMRDALTLELAHVTVADDGSRLTYARLVARKLIDMAIAGDLRAIKEINDRVDGKPHKGTHAQQPGKMIIEWDDGTSSEGGVGGGNPSPRDECGSPGTPGETANVAPPQRVGRPCPAVPLSPSPQSGNDRIDAAPDPAPCSAGPTMPARSGGHALGDERERGGETARFGQRTQARCATVERPWARRHFGRTKPIGETSSAWRDLSAEVGGRHPGVRCGGPERAPERRFGRNEANERSSPGTWLTSPFESALSRKHRAKADGHPRRLSVARRCAPIVHQDLPTAESARDMLSFNGGPRAGGAS
jgi:hypothetical protein